MYIHPSKKKYVNAAIVAGIILVAVIFMVTRGKVSSYSHKYEGFDLTAPESNRVNYFRYLEGHASTATPSEGVVIDIISFNADKSEGAELLYSYEGAENILMTSDTSSVEFSVNVPTAGLYTLKIEYFPVKSRGVDIERAVYINGAIPFYGADLSTFSRIWSDESVDFSRFPEGVRKDNQGNQIRATQIEIPRWESAFFTDSQGHVTEPYRFYFKEGENTISLVAVNEPLAIKSFELTPVSELPLYADYIKEFNNAQYPASLSEPIKIQGEDAVFRSSQSLYPFFDTSSGTTEPYSVGKIVLNAIGGERWRVPGQWIEWEVDIPEDGLYRVSLKARQNYTRGIVSNRSLYINGEIPVKEALAIPFFYNNSWQLITPSDEDGNDLYFPLQKGKNSIKLEVTLGDLSHVLAQIEESVFRLNEIYRQILVLTGPEPDPDRDYQVEVFYPEILERMAFESRYLYKVVDQLIAYSGQMGSEVASLQTLAQQLEAFVKKPHTIPRVMVNFKENIAAMGNSLVGLNSAPLDIDWIMVSTADTKLPKVNETFLKSAQHEIVSFFTTFFIDYNNIGDVHDKNDKSVTEVWIFSGRDQSTVLKTMIDDTYTPETENPINLKLVGLEALMPAVVAGTGPDVALTVNNGDPVNYAFRKASVDLTQFGSFNEVKSEFHDSAFVPYTYSGGIFGMPETQLFPVMFYRTDILGELGISLPQTWDELIAVFPTLQHKNLSAGIPSVERKINGMNIPDLSNYFSQLYQRGGALFSENGARSLIADELGVKAFEFYTRFFTHYKMPLHYDFVNRFRSGEMPIGFADYNNFNTLAVFAPEIRGLWEFTIIPGTRMEDGTINRSTAAWGNASMILSNAKDINKAWEFMEWWVSADTQVRFGLELESIMGTAARYPTANREAFNRLAWNAKDSATLNEQWDWVVGTPEVPGGYYAGRHIVNAVRRVINKDEDTRETLLNYNRQINDELTKKREEFGLN